MAFTRRRLLGGAAAGGLALAGGGFGLGSAVAGGRTDGDESDASGRIAFTGTHQAGIVTPQQDQLHFAAFDVEPGVGAEELATLMRRWSTAAARTMAGQPVGDADGAALAPPQDTGEAVGLAPSRLTVTFGFGPSLFDDRFGLADRRPAALRPIPPLPGDELQPGRTGGDLCVQACADDPQVAFHAVRNLARIGRGTVTMRWSQLGFGRAASNSRKQDTPRNLMGFKDGTANLKLEDSAAMAGHVWVGGDRPGEPAWLAGGTYLVARRIRMLIETWDRASLADQETTIGRTKGAGAPLGHHDEFAPFSPADLPPASHVRLAHPKTNAGAQLLRRGYNYTDGMDETLGQLDAGLFFLSFQRDPAAFVTVAHRLASSDLLNEYIKHTGSGVWAIPPGVGRGGWVGQGLLSA